MIPMTKILCLALCFAYVCCGPMTFSDEADEFYPIKGVKEDRFDWQLFQAIAGESEKNVVVSPLSVKVLLSLISEAAENGSRTKEELSKILSNTSSDFVSKYYKEVLTSLEEGSEEYELLFGSRIFLGKDINPSSSYLERAREIFHISTERVDFSKASQAAEIINEWSAAATKGNIKDLVNADDLETASIVLTNAIYFKGSWVKPFGRDDTADRTFTLKGGKDVRAPFMFLSESFYYAESEELNARLLRMAYKGNKYAMTIILPKEEDGVDRLISELSSPVIQSIQTQKMQRVEELSIEIPLFKFDFTAPLEDSLQLLGVSEIFSDSAQLPGFGSGLYVSRIKQKAGILVDEKGTEAYAASDAELDNRFGKDDPFAANHPFVFFIEDESTGTLLFAGKVVNPLE